VFLEAEGNLRSHPSWLALKPKALTPAQATQRLLVGLVSGGAGATPTPSEVVQPAAVRHDLYRMIKEGTAALRRGGSGNLGPITQEVGGPGCWGAAVTKEVMQNLSTMVISPASLSHTRPKPCVRTMLGRC
jgi:hypothetical protein